MAEDVVWNSRKNSSNSQNSMKLPNNNLNKFDNERQALKQTYLKLFRCFILVLSCILAFSVRLFSVVRYEVVIHEFDPYFNYMTTKYLTENGFYSFLNWFDSRAWYPLGRIIGGTIYPGLMLTSGLIYEILHSLNITLSIQQVCVFIGPLFSCFTTLLTYYLTAEIDGNFRSALLASAFIAIVPGYISRSVAGSYDNEAIAIFCMLLTYYCWIKSIKTGRIVWATLCSLSYFYMASSWGGYVFIINLVPLHVFILILMGRFKSSLYISYSIFYLFGTLLTMQIPFVSFQSITTSEHFAAFCIFALVQILFFMDYLSAKMTKQSFDILFRSLIVYFIGLIAVVLLFLVLLGKISPFTGRLYSLLDPSYAKKYLPIIASVSEHQPTTWSSFYFDLHLLLFLFPVGIYVCFRRLSDENIFLVLYGITSLYFTSIMVRLMLVLAPAMCIISGIGLSKLLSFSCQQYKYSDSDQMYYHDKKLDKNRQRKSSLNDPTKHQNSKFFVMLSACLLVFYSVHCVWVTSEAYSSPSIVLSARNRDGSRLMFDDFREAYYWLRMNTANDAKILSWWDYGYQISAMANRTTIVDNNTWNNTHISIVGQAFAANEKDSYDIVRRLDVDYILILFGGFIGYSSDDLNKFLWMIRIGSSTENGKNILEKNYLSKKGEFRVDKEAPKMLKNSLLYRLSYYQFGRVFIDNREKVSGFDRVRQTEIGVKDIKLEHFEEAYTTEHWLVRIYRVKKPLNRS